MTEIMVADYVDEELIKLDVSDLTQNEAENLITDCLALLKQLTEKAVVKISPKLFKDVVG